MRDLINYLVHFFLAFFIVSRGADAVKMKEDVAGRRLYVRMQIS